MLNYALTLENTGVGAYLGAGPTVSSDAVFEAAASIQSVEARHATFLDELNGALPFPNGFDEAKSMDETTRRKRLTTHRQDLLTDGSVSDRRAARQRRFIDLLADRDDVLVYENDGDVATAVTEITVEIE